MNRVLWLLLVYSSFVYVEILPSLHSTFSKVNQIMNKSFTNADRTHHRAIVDRNLLCDMSLWQPVLVATRLCGDQPLWQPVFVVKKLTSLWFKFNGAICHLKLTEIFCLRENLHLQEIKIIERTSKQSSWPLLLMHVDGSTMLQYWLLIGCPTVSNEYHAGEPKYTFTLPDGQFFFF